MHKYICEECRKNKACVILECKGNCVKLCGLCIINIKPSLKKVVLRSLKDTQAS